MRRALALLLLCVGCAHQIPSEESPSINVNDLPIRSCEQIRAELTQEEVDYQYLACTTTDLARKVCDFYHPYFNMECTQILSKFCLIRVQMFIQDREYEYQDCITQQSPDKDKK